MITVKIGESERELDTADEQWINQQINHRRADGQSVCVRVIIRKGELDMALSTPNCASRAGGRAPRAKEQELFDLWGQRGLNNFNFTGGNLIAFLKQLKRFF